MNRIFTAALTLVAAPFFAQLTNSDFASAKAQPVVLEANPLQKQMEAAIYDFFTSVQSLDGQRLANNYAPNGTLEDPVGTGVIQGPQAIAQFFAGLQQGLGIGRITPRVKDMFVGAGSSTEVAVRWELTGYTTAGKQIILQGIGIFKFRAAGASRQLQLESVREFWDPVQLNAQLK